MTCTSDICQINCLSSGLFMRNQERIHELFTFPDKTKIQIIALIVLESLVNTNCSLLNNPPDFFVHCLASARTWEACPVLLCLM
jgi:hypothetical protein